jgi:hypothetical protein
MAIKNRTTFHHQPIINLIFINMTALNNAIIKKWQVNHKISFTTDHFPITWNINQGKQYKNNNLQTTAST